MTLDDFPAVKDCLLEFFKTINLDDFEEFNYVYSDFFHGVFVPRYLKIKYEPNNKNYSVFRKHYEKNFPTTVGNFIVEELRGSNSDTTIKYNMRDCEFQVGGRILYAKFSENVNLSYCPSVHTQYQKLTQIVVGVEFDADVSDFEKTNIIEQLKKTYKLDFDMPCEKTTSFDISFEQQYKGQKVGKKSINAKLIFDSKQQNILVFSWDKSSKCFVGKFDNGEKLKRLGWLTVSQDAVEALKQFGKEPDNSFGNKTIAKRMKKYIYL